ncbi:hypothetical protein ACLOJK_008664 [Asimina triloba]
MLMSSRKKEDEKNEKIIRGLLKVQENRRCINCKSLVYFPALSREFTHRVKSVSMAKFTSEEVGALKAGGNERAKEIYFKEFDPRRHFIPDSCNIERLRDFIRHVYVERRYTGERGVERNLSVKVERDNFSENRRVPRSPLYEEKCDSHYHDRPRPVPSPVRRFDRSLRYSCDDRSPGYEYESRRYGSSRRSTTRFEVVDDRVRDDRFRSRNQNNRPEDQRPTEEASKPEGKSPRHQKDISSSSPRLSNLNHRKDNNSPSSRGSNLARDILGEDVPPLNSPKTNDCKAADASELTKRNASSTSFASREGKAAELKRVPSGSLIDFNEEPELPVTVALTETLSAPVTANAGTTSTDSVSNPESVKTSDAGQMLPIQQQQPSLLSSVNSHQSPVQQITQQVGATSSQQWNASFATIAQAPLTPLPHQPSQVAPTTTQEMGAASLLLPPPPAEAKVGGRKELPADLFTMFYSPAPAPVPSWHGGLHHGMGYAMQYPRQPTAIPSKSTNPFDIGSEPTQAPSSTFPPMAPLQLALPNMPATSHISHTSNLTAASPHRQDPGGYASAQAAFGLLGASQQSATAYSQQTTSNAFPSPSNAFPSHGGNPFG